MIRTSDPRIRNPVLYPAALRAQKKFLNLQKKLLIIYLLKNYILCIKKPNKHNKLIKKTKVIIHIEFFLEYLKKI